MKKSFISILGTTDYSECRHSFGDKISEQPVKYVQEDLIKFFCSDFAENDEIRIFLTKDAKKKNWENTEHANRNDNPIQNVGLKNRLDCLQLKCKIIPKDINEGFNEAEIWEIFQTIYNTFSDEEEVIVDVTHSFRSLPMLMITLLNFAKQVKKIKVSGIYYAAFESLGKNDDIKKLQPQERVTPILDLTSFSELQDWTNATYDFIHNANVKSLKDLTKYQQKIKGKNQTNKDITSTLLQLNIIIDNFLLCRGSKIKEYNFGNLKENILNLKSTSDQIKPINLLIEKLYEKISKFEQQGIKNVLYSVELCFQHNFYQQAITLLQELIVTSILLKLNKDPKIKDLRQVVSNSFYIKLIGLDKSKWNKLSKQHSELTESILELPIMNEIKSDYEYLTEIRNDINHGGFSSDPKPSDSIVSRLRNSIDNITPKILNYL